MAVRLIRIALAALLALGILLVGGAALALLAFRPDAFKSALISAVQQRYHRRLELPGTLQLHLFTPFTLQTGPMRLSAPDGHTAFAQAADMRLHLAPLALLRRKVVIEGIELDAPRLRLHRDASGAWNFSDLLGAPAGNLPTLAMRHLRVRDGDVTLSDATRGLDGRLTMVDADASGIGQAGWHTLSLRALAALSDPRADVRINLRGQLHVDADGSGSLRNLVVRSDGSVLGGARMLSTLRAELRWTAAPTRSLQLLDLHLRTQGRMSDGQPLQVELGESMLQWSETWISAAPLQAQALIGAAPGTIRVRVHGGPFSGPDADLVARRLRLDVQRTAPLPLQLQLQADAHLNLPARSAVIDTLDTRAAWGTPARQWQARGQGSYTPAQGLRARLQGGGPGAVTQIDVRHAADGWTLQAQAGALDLGVAPDETTWRDVGALLRRLPATQLRLQADSVRWGPLRLSSVTAQAHDDASTLSLDKLQAQAWGGTLQARGSVGLHGAPATLHASLQHIALSGMLSALCGGAAVDGNADLQADLQWRGARDGALRAPDGSASLQARNGHLQGVDLGTPTASPGAHARSTAFGKLDADATIADGVARLDKLQLHGASGDWQGDGSVDLGSTALVDLRLRAVPGKKSASNAVALRVRGAAAAPVYTWLPAPLGSAPAAATAAAGYSPK